VRNRIQGATMSRSNELIRRLQKRKNAMSRRDELAALIEIDTRIEARILAREQVTQDEVDSTIDLLEEHGRFKNLDRCGEEFLHALVRSHATDRAPRQPDGRRFGLEVRDVLQRANAVALECLPDRIVRIEDSEAIVVNDEKEPSAVIDFPVKID